MNACDVAGGRASGFMAKSSIGACCVFGAWTVGMDVCVTKGDLDHSDGTDNPVGTGLARGVRGVRATHSSGDAR